MVCQMTGIYTSGWYIPVIPPSWTYDRYIPGIYQPYKQFWGFQMRVAHLYRQSWDFKAARGAGSRETATRCKSKSLQNSKIVRCSNNNKMNLIFFQLLLR